MTGMRPVALSVLLAGCASSPPGTQDSPRSALPPLHDSKKASSIQISQVCEGSRSSSGDLPFPRLLTRDGKPSPCVDPPASDDDVRVEIDAVVDPNGRVTRARVIRSHPRCDQPCLASVSGHVFLPSQKSGRSTFGSAILVCRWGATAGRSGECT